MNLYEAFARLKSTATNLPYLPLVLKPLDWRVRWSELNKANYETPHAFYSAAFSAIFPVYAPFRGVPHLPYEVPDDVAATVTDDQAWYFSG